MLEPRRELEPAVCWWRRCCGVEFVVVVLHEETEFETVVLLEALLLSPSGIPFACPIEQVDWASDRTCVALYAAAVRLDGLLSRPSGLGA